MKKTTVEKKSARKNGVLRLLFVALSVALSVAILVLGVIRLNEYQVILKSDLRFLEV